MSVKRYEVNGSSSIFENENGSLVDYDDYAALEARCAALAAENAGLNEKMNKLATWPGIEFYSSEWEFNNGDGNAALEYMCDTETPATDAFLAEVRASAVDEVCLKISNAIINCYQDGQIGLDAAATICGDFASEIRKGVQS